MKMNKRNEPIIRNRHTSLTLWAIAAVLVVYLGYRFTLGEPAEVVTETFPIMKSSRVIVTPNGHAYQYIAAPNQTWQAARVGASKLSFRGQRGYLATIDNETEYRLIINTVFQKEYPDVTYLGGRQTSPGEWRWVTGPDASADGGKGKLFWTGYAKGSVQEGAYADWMFTAFHEGGKWDVRKVCCVVLFSYRRPQLSASLGNGDRDEGVAGYLVEFGQN
jgi:hypothetical protein